ncbi:MAG: hypothetical protein F9K44_01875 [Hyphomicrobiaceae bacterium]|nr:MAG: hypothetical protein F9K44_01875 [Hyphomicrobiaceae bacterium]
MQSPRYMRALVVTAALLALLKVGYQEYLFRVSARDVIVATYQERAVSHCQKQARSQGIAGILSNWSKPSSVSLVIGKGGIDVQFWEINNAMWNARYRNPYLHIVADEKSSAIYCEYDILNGSAVVQRL